jgi:hypothetical protein
MWKEIYTEFGKETPCQKYNLENRIINKPVMINGRYIKKYTVTAWNDLGVFRIMSNVHFPVLWGWNVVYVLNNAD